MTRFDPAMVSAINPRLQIGEDEMDHWQVLLCLFWVTPERKHVVPIAHSNKVIISLPTVSADNRAKRHIVIDESGKRFYVATRNRRLHLFDVGDNTEPKTPGINKFLDRNTAFMSIPPFRAASFGVLTGERIGPVFVSS